MSSAASSGRGLVREEEDCLHCRLLQPQGSHFGSGKRRNFGLEGGGGEEGVLSLGGVYPGGKEVWREEVREDYWREKGGGSGWCGLVDGCMQETCLRSGCCVYHSHWLPERSHPLCPSPSQPHPWLVLKKVQVAFRSIEIISSLGSVSSVSSMGSVSSLGSVFSLGSFPLWDHFLSGISFLSGILCLR